MAENIIVHDNGRTKSMIKAGHRYLAQNQYDDDTKTDENIITVNQSLNNTPDTMANHFRYLIIATKLSGMLFFYEPNASKCNIHKILLLSYHVIIELLTWSNVMRFFFAYKLDESFSPELMTKVYIHIRYFFCAIACTLSCFTATKGPTALKKLDSYHQKYSCQVNGDKIKKQSIIVLIVACLVWLAAALYTLFCSSSCQSFVKLNLMPFSDGFASITDIPFALRLVFTLWTTIMYAVFSVFIAWFIMLGMTIKKEFETITSKLCSGKEDEREIEAIRKQHFHLSTVTQELDEVFSVHILIIFITHIPCTCINIYLLLLWQISVQERIALSFGMVHLLLVFFLIIAVGTMLNEKVRHINYPSINLNRVFFPLLYEYSTVKALYFAWDVFCEFHE